MRLTPVKKEISGENMIQVFFKRAEEHGEDPLLWYRQDGVFTPISWIECAGRVIKIAAYLAASGIKKGDKVGIFSFNRWEWWIADLAVLSIGGVTVPIYATNSAEESRHVLDHAGVRICFIGDSEQLDKILAVKDSLPYLEKLIHFDNKTGRHTYSFSDVLESGARSGKGREVIKRIQAIKKEDLATILYTSGTTGNPKGVMLTHGNIISEIIQLCSSLGQYIGEGDRFLSFLPLSHALERAAGEFCPIMLHSQVAFAESFKTISSDLLDIQPTVLVSVPRLFEKINAGVNANLATMNPVKRMIVKWALRAGKQNIINIRKNTEPTGWLAKKIAFADKKVFSVLKKQIGLSRNKLAISGGGPLSFSDCEFFLSIGVSVAEGYGLTEASPCTNVNIIGNIKPGTVGPAMSDTKVKISDEGEVLVKGPQIMKGYYKDPAATKDAISPDGWLKTGDLGLIDEEGFLTITGRIKDIIVTAGGKNISPQNIEASLLLSKYIDNIAIIGDRRKYLSALVLPAFSELEAWARARGISDTSKAGLVNNPDVQKFYQSEFDNLLSNVARVEQVKRFTLLTEVWSIENGELTPTLKVKRRVIEKKYADIISKMYED